MYTFLPGTETLYYAAILAEVYQIESKDNSLAPLLDIPVKDRFQVAFPFTARLFLLFNGQGAEWERPSDEAILFNRETGAETALGDMQQLIGIILKSWKLPILR